MDEWKCPFGNQRIKESKNVIPTNLVRDVSAILDYRSAYPSERPGRVLSLYPGG